jgi:pyrrolidone-carboxylate peptidase
MNMPAGFVHLPALPAQVAARDTMTPGASMGLETMIVGIKAAIEAINTHLHQAHKGH